MKHAFRDSVTGSVVTGTVEEIVVKVMRYRAAKGYSPVRNRVYREVLNYIQGQNKSAGQKAPRVNFRDALKAGKAAVKITTGDIVSKKEMNRRWQICKNCPQKTNTKECFGCNAAKFLSEITKATKSMFGTKVDLPGESKRFSCGVCGCSLSMLLPTKTEHLHQDNDAQAQRRPAFCWMKEDGHNYRKS